MKIYNIGSSGSSTANCSRHYHSPFDDCYLYTNDQCSHRPWCVWQLLTASVPGLQLLTMVPYQPIEKYAHDQQSQLLFNRQYNDTPSVLWHCWLGDRKGILRVKSRVLVCWWWHFDWSFARLIARVITTTSITLSSNKIQNGDILVPTNPGSPGKWPLKWREYNDALSMLWCNQQAIGRTSGLQNIVLQLFVTVPLWNTFKDGFTWTACGKVEWW